MFSLLVGLGVVACADLIPAPSRLPEIALIIDDIGYHYEKGRSAIELQWPFAYSILPFSPYAERLAYLANALGKDVMVHLPMEAETDNHLLGPGALWFDMSRTEIEGRLVESLAAVPHAIGINNHMGSRLTREPIPMRWLMHAIHERGRLFFVDSRTTSHSIALYSAHQAKVASTGRDVFLDNIQTQEYIEQQLNSLVVQAKKNGHALGIAHPHPITIGILQNWQPSIAGVRLVKIRDYIATHQDYGGDERSPGTLRLAVSECSDKSGDTGPTENPNAQR